MNATQKFLAATAFANHYAAHNLSADEQVENAVCGEGDVETTSFTIADIKKAWRRDEEFQTPYGTLHVWRAIQLNGQGTVRGDWYVLDAEGDGRLCFFSGN